MRLFDRLSAIVIISSLFSISIHAAPDFRSIKDVSKRVYAFVEFIAPIVHSENQKILENRAKIENIRETVKKKEAVLVSDHDWLKKVAKSHKLKNFDHKEDKHFEELLLRVDVIPVPLALAQAATESGWGTSGFARNRHNYFGHMVGAQARKFSSPDHSVREYMRNLNSHGAYPKFRKTRAKLREQNKKMDGVLLADGLKAYCETGMEYVRYIKKVMSNQKNVFAKVAETLKLA